MKLTRLPYHPYAYAYISWQFMGMAYRCHNRTYSIFTIYACMWWPLYHIWDPFSLASINSSTTKHTYATSRYTRTLANCGKAFYYLASTWIVGWIQYPYCCPTPSPVTPLQKQFHPHLSRQHVGRQMLCIDHHP